MRIFCPLLLVIFTLNTTFAQEQEYLVTVERDTVYGKPFISNTNGLQWVKMKNGKQKNSFKVHQIKTLVSKKGTFHVLKIRGRYQLSLLIKSGYLSYYKFSEDPKITPPSFSAPLLIMQSGKQLEISKLIFRQSVSKFLEDCETLVEKFESKEYSRHDVLKIVDDYNECSVISFKKREEQNENKKKTDEVTVLKNLVEASSDFSENEEVLEMLNDVESRMKEGKNLPNYLVNGLKEKFRGHNDMLEQLESVLK